MSAAVALVSASANRAFLAASATASISFARANPAKVMLVVTRHTIADPSKTNTKSTGAEPDSSRALELRNLGQRLVENALERWASQRPEQDHEARRHERHEHPAGHVATLIVEPRNEVFYRQFSRHTPSLQWQAQAHK